MLQPGLKITLLYEYYLGTCTYLFTDKYAETIRKSTVSNQYTDKVIVQLFPRASCAGQSIIFIHRFIFLLYITFQNNKEDHTGELFLRVSLKVSLISISNFQYLREAINIFYSKVS